MRGRRRAAARRTMIAAAGKALEWVSLDALQPKHLKELAHAIHGALVDPLVRFFCCIPSVGRMCKAGFPSAPASRKC